MTWRKLFLGTWVVLLLLIIPGSTVQAETKVNLDELTRNKLAEAAKVNTSCLSCHINKAEGNIVGKSVHSQLPCTKCHEDANPNGKPTVLLGGRELAYKVNQKCRNCHFNITKEYEKSVHGKVDQNGKQGALCSDCHGSHNIRKAASAESMMVGKKSVETCLKCHEHKYRETYYESFHGRSVSLGSTKSATCASCHGSHDILGPAEPTSAVAKANIPKTCAQCHLKAQENFAKGTEHAELKATGPGATTYWTLKFFTWLTIIVFSMLIIHIELELFRRFRNAKQGKK